LIGILRASSPSLIRLFYTPADAGKCDRNASNCKHVDPESARGLLCVAIEAGGWMNLQARAVFNGGRSSSA